MIRLAANRLLCVTLFAALTLFSAWVAVETAARIVGRGGHLLPVDYRSWWHHMQQWNPSNASRTVIFVGVALLGLALLLFELWPTGRLDTLEISRSDGGHVLLRIRTVAPFLRGHLVQQPWIRSANPRLHLSGIRADVTVAPRTVRPWDSDELADAATGLRSDLERLGLEPGRIDLTPRKPNDQTRVR